MKLNQIITTVTVFIRSIIKINIIRIVFILIIKILNLLIKNIFKNKINSKKSQIIPPLNRLKIVFFIKNVNNLIINYVNKQYNRKEYQLDYKNYNNWLFNSIGMSICKMY